MSEKSYMLSTNIVNNNGNSQNSSNNNTKMIKFDRNKPKNINSMTNNTINNTSGTVYMNLTPPNSNNSNNIVPPQKPQKSMKRIQENNVIKDSQINNNSTSDNLYLNVNSLIPARKTSLGSPFIKNKRNQLKLKMSSENEGSTLKSYDNIPSPVLSVSSLDDGNLSLRNISDGSINNNNNNNNNDNNDNNLTVPAPIQKQPLFKPKAKSGKEHINYQRRESIKKQHPIIMILDKGQSSPTISQGPLSAPPHIELYNKEIKDDYKIQSIGIDYDKNKNILILDEENDKRKEKGVDELNKKLSKEMEKKHLKEKEALKKKNKKEAKREKKEKKNEEKLEKLNTNKFNIFSPQLLIAEEIDTLDSPTSAKSTTKKEKAKKGWYQIALSKLPTKSLNSHNKKSNLFSEFKKGDTNTEILIKRSPTCSSHTSVRRRVVNSNRASVCTNGTTNSVSTQASIPYASHFDSLPEVPAILKKCIALIEECGLEAEGLYRISGNSSNVQNLLKLFQHEPDKIELLPPGNEPSKSSSRKTFKSSSNIPPPSSNLYKDSRYLYDNDIHVVTGCIKSWLRNGIPPKNEPLWPYHLYDDLIQASQIKDYTSKMIKFQDLVHALPPANFVSLNFLFEHLFKVSTFSEQNKMTISNLAIIFGPTLLRSPPNSNESEMMIITRMPFQCKAVEVLIEQYEFLFGPIEYEEESIDEEDLGKELINSSLNEIQNQLQGEIKDDEVVILKNISNNDIDMVVSTTNKMGNTVHNKFEFNKIKFIDDNNKNNKEIKNINENELNKNYENTFNMVYKETEDNINNNEEPIEASEYNNSILRNERNYYEFNKEDHENQKSKDAHETGFESIPRSVNSSDFELSFIEQGNKYDKRKYYDLNAESEGKGSEYQKLIKMESMQKMKKENKDKSKIKIKNSTSSNKLKQLLSRPNKSKKMENDFNLSTSVHNYSDIKSLISNPVSLQHNTEKNDKFISNNINKNQESLSFNKNEENVNLMTTTTEDNKNEINMTIPTNNIYRILNENKNHQIFNEPNGTENDFSEKASESKNGNNDYNKSKEIGKDKESLQRISNSSMGIFQEQFLMDGFENDIKSSLNDFLSKKFDDENDSKVEDKDENKLKKNSIIRLSTQLTAKWNLELEKHLEQIYRDKKRSKLFINDDLENIEEKIKNISSQTSLSKN